MTVFDYGIKLDPEGHVARPTTLEEALHHKDGVRKLLYDGYGENPWVPILLPTQNAGFVHYDALGREIKPGAYVAGAWMGATMALYQVIKLTEKRLKCFDFLYGSENIKTPKDVIVINDEQIIGE